MAQINRVSQMSQGQFVPATNQIAQEKKKSSPFFLLGKISGIILSVIGVAIIVTGIIASLLNPMNEISGSAQSSVTYFGDAMGSFASMLDGISMLIMFNYISLGVPMLIAGLCIMSLFGCLQAICEKPITVEVSAPANDRPQQQNQHMPQATAQQQVFQQQPGQPMNAPAMSMPPAGEPQPQQFGNMQAPNGQQPNMQQFPGQPQQVINNEGQPPAQQPFQSQPVQPVQPVQQFQQMPADYPAQQFPGMQQGQQPYMVNHTGMPY